VIDLDAVRRDGAEDAARQALDHLARPELDGIWIHLDCDAIHDELMPAVDYRIPDGLQWEELEAVLGATVDGGRIAGLEITIYNPALDKTGDIATTLVSSLVRALHREAGRE
jgi:arginase